MHIIVWYCFKLAIMIARSEEDNVFADNNYFMIERDYAEYLKGEFDMEIQ